MDEKEIRTYTVELRADGDSRKLTGHAAVFNKWSEDLGYFREKIDPAAFDKSLKADDVRALFNHDPNYVLGRNKAGTLELSTDNKGLKVEIDPPDTQWARDLAVSIGRGDISQMSFGFRTITDEWTHFNDSNKPSDRVLLEARLFDVSPVTYPAYPQTDVKVRSIIANKLRSITEVDAEEREFDLDQILEIITRAKEGAPLTESDILTIRTHMDVLNGYLPTTEPDPDATGLHDDGALRDLAHLARVREMELLGI